MFLLMSYFVLRNVYWTFNLQPVFCLFETLKMFYPPKGRLLADSCRGPIVFTYVLFRVSKTLEAFQSTDSFLQKKSLKMFHSPKGLSEAEPKGSIQWFFFFWEIFVLGEIDFRNFWGKCVWGKFWV